MQHNMIAAQHVLAERDGVGLATKRLRRPTAACRRATNLGLEAAVANQHFGSPSMSSS